MPALEDRHCRIVRVHYQGMGYAALRCCSTCCAIQLSTSCSGQAEALPSLIGFGKVPALIRS